MTDDQDSGAPAGGGQAAGGGTSAAGATSVAGETAVWSPAPASGAPTLADRPAPATPAAATPATHVTPATSAGSAISAGAEPRPPSGTRLQPSEMLAGRFVIVRFIGRGGMGDVYEAEDMELGERVALKTVRPEVAHLPGAVERFRREIHLARRVTHANVCRIFDVFRHADVTFFTMELLAGETLEQRLRGGGRLTPEAALPIAQQVAEGLTAAHRAGVIHRDFKPANIMLVRPPAGALGSPPGSAPGARPAPSTEEGPRAVITDFGLARTFEEGEGLTLRGDILGTPAYMAPEQVTGGEVTAATDIYSLGCVLYEMVTGTPPFVGSNSFSTAFKRLQEDPRPPQQHVPGLPPAWDAAILRCLERQPADRFPQARDAAAALAGAAVTRTPTTMRRRRRRGLLAAGAVALLVALVALALAGLRWLRPGGSASPARAAAEPLTDYLHGPERLYADGVGALAKLDGARAQQLFERAIGAGSNQWLAHSGLAVALAELGHERRAATEAKLAFDHAAGLPAEAGQLVGARYWQVTGHPDKAAAAYQDLWRAHPDRLEYALGLARALDASGRGQEALQLIGALRGQPVAAGAAARLDLAEAEAARATADFPRQTTAARQAGQEAARAGDDLLSARALLLEGMALSKRGDNRGALAAYHKAEGIYAGTGDQRNLAQVLGGTAIVLYYQGNLGMAGEKAKEALDSFKELGDLRGESGQLGLLAGIEATQGNLAAAEGHYREALRSYRALGDRAREAQVLGNLGMVASNQGKPAEAEQRFQQSLAVYRQLQDRDGQAKQLHSLAELRMGQLDLDRADAYLGEALTLATAVDDQSLRTDALVTRGSLAYFRGNVAAARASYGEALTESRTLGDKHVVAVIQLALANLELDEGHPSPAEVYAGSAVAEFQAEHAETSEAEAEAALAQALLGEHSPTEARAAIARAERLAGRQAPLQLQCELAMSRARVIEATDPPGAIRVLEGALAAGRGAPPAAFLFELRLALGEQEIRHGDRRRGADFLAALEADARRLGFLRIADEAARARKGEAAR